MIKLLTPLLIFFLVSLLQPADTPKAACEHEKSEGTVSSSSEGNRTPSERFNQFNTLVRDGKIDRNEALTILNTLLKELKEDYYRRDGKDFPGNKWIFPLEGYDVLSITGGRNKGYISSGYDYFSGNRHGGHPSFDIFIYDRNQDGLDDRSGQPVKVRSLGGGIVVAMEREWEEGSILRGGKYIWVYDPGNELLLYYAHNSKITVGLGDILTPGEFLATVGRSGLNAAKKRSPTHLHLTVLEVKNGKPLPLNVYNDLAHAGKKCLN
ncbi:MAG: M23 family metallopeptidase [Pseudomonadota bacterium]